MGKATKYSELVTKHSIPVRCPLCGNIVAHDDMRQTIDIVARCDKCRVRVVYNVENGATKFVDIPERNCASGLTYR